MQSRGEDTMTVEHDDVDSRARLPRRQIVGKQLWGLRRIFVVILTPIILLPLPLINNEPKAQCAYAIILMAVFWITEAVPIAVTSLVPIFLFPVMGLHTAKEVSATYVTDTSMFLLGGLTIAVAIETWNVHKHLALRSLMLVKTEPRWLMAAIMLVTWFLSMWISNTVTTAMMIPILQGLMEQLRTSSTDCEEDAEERMEGNDMFPLKEYNSEDEHEETKDSPMGRKTLISEKPIETNGSLTSPLKNRSYKTLGKEDASHQRLCRGMALSVCYAANIGGMACLPGTPPNLVLKDQAETVYREHNGTSPINFATWMVFSLPLSMILLVIAWIWLQIYFLGFGETCRCLKRGQQGEHIKKAVIQEQLKQLGPFSFAQWCITGFFLVLVALWITRDLGGVGGWGHFFPESSVSDSTSAIFITFLLFVCPATVPNLFRRHKGIPLPKVKPILRWQDVHEKMPWGVYLLLGASLTLAKASKESGLSEWLGGRLQVFAGTNPYVMLVGLTYIVTFATELATNTAIAILIGPIMAQLAASMGIHPLLVMFPTNIATAFAFMLPVATVSNAIVISYGKVRVIDMAACGLVLNILCPPIIVFAAATWGNAFFGFHTLPDGFQNMSSVALDNVPYTNFINITNG